MSRGVTVLKILSLLLLSSSCTDGILYTGVDTAVDEKPQKSTIPTDSSEVTGTSGTKDTIDEIVTKDTDTGSISDAISTIDTIDTSDTSDIEDTLSRTYCGTLGFFYENLCWYLSRNNDDCYDLCEYLGGYNEATPDYIGTSDIETIRDEKINHCENILRGLSRVWPGAVTAYYVKTINKDDSGLGVGCHIDWSSPPGYNSYWVESPPFNPNDRTINILRVCACGEKRDF
jgi:hypothetical protein